MTRITWQTYKLTAGFITHLEMNNDFISYQFVSAFPYCHHGDGGSCLYLYFCNDHTYALMLLHFFCFNPQSPSCNSQLHDQI